MFVRNVMGPVPLRVAFRSLQSLVATTAVLLCEACSPSPAHPVNRTMKMRMITYASAGPIKDSINPALAFPVIDIFSPKGDLVCHSFAVQDSLSCLRERRAQSQQTSPFFFPTDTLATIGHKYKTLSLPMSELSGRYTLLFINAPGCRACEVQSAPIDRVDLKEYDLNRILLTLTLQ